MFCYQCQETAKNTGCTVRGVCGKNKEVAGLQDLLIYTLKGIAEVVVKGKVDISEYDEMNYGVLNGLFMTITNANFDDESIVRHIQKMLSFRDGLKKSVNVDNLSDAATFTVDSKESMLGKAASVGVLATENEDIRSLRETITYGLKGMAAYAEHAKNIGKENLEVNAFLYKALFDLLDDTLSVDDLVALTLKTGEYGVKVMALLDEANTSLYIL